MDHGWLYPHFLDRELLTTCGLYGNLSPRRIQDDFVMALVSITEPAHICMSVLFESDYAFELFSRYRAVFSRQGIIRLAGTHDGKPSDGAVASLYSGTRREWAPQEAAKITYQFTRVLRWSLSRADVRDRDASVKRLREKGVAIGTRWARPAVLSTNLAREVL
jgi:hypothetical protein